uniref:Phospholipid scramblase n=1 Tax=Amorphochlora amoebiformis TaxID=1561963 RepID=A0A7S0H289_9EUKA
MEIAGRGERLESFDGGEESLLGDKKKSSSNGEGGGPSPSAPILQEMNQMAITAQPASVNQLDSVLNDSHGLLIRERFYWSQVACAACERKTQFKVAKWDPSMPGILEDNDFVSQPLVLEFYEESDCFCRYCLHSMRELKLGIFSGVRTQESSMAWENPNNGWPPGRDPHVILFRPFKCNIPLFCCLPCPGEISAIDGPSGALRARVMQDWKCWNCCWPCDVYLGTFDATGVRTFTVHTPRACGSGCINCCAPSCCNRTHTSFIRRGNAIVGPSVGAIEVHWPGWNSRGLLQAYSAAENFAVIFPAQSTTNEKLQIVSAWSLSNFLYWEKRANQRN